MDKLKQNRFLAVTGVVTLAAVAAFVVLVLPEWNQASAKNTQITKAGTEIGGELPTLPGSLNIEEWEKHRGDLQAQYDRTLGDIVQLDKSLEQWFDGLDSTSTFDTFLTRYNDERERLEVELISKGVLIGSPRMEGDKQVESKSPGFNWVTRDHLRLPFSTQEQQNQAKEILQKRFNVCRAIVNAITGDKGKPSRLLDVTFLEKPAFIQTSLSGGTPEVRAALIPVDSKIYFKGIFPLMELLLPLNGEEEGKEAKEEGEGKESKTKKYLGRTLTFGFAVEMKYQDMPDLVHNLLHPTVEPILNVSIIGLNVFVPVPNPPKKEETVTGKASEEAEVRKKYADMEANCPPPVVHVYVACQVFDFDPAGIPTFVKKP
ncbi:MAG TPA: hypothetical protein VK661_12215 [Planctomycetota bacterium]|nr:hypothetical protein [Planctomycetota bacterium]